MSVRPQIADETVRNGLIHSVRGILAGEANLERAVPRIASVLTLFLGHPDLLRSKERRADPEKYRQHILHVEDDGSFSLSALIWLPGQKTSIHDHVAWGVVGIHQGILREDEYRLEENGGDRFLVPTRSVTCGFGDVTAVIPPGDIHLLVNPGPEPAVSLHIYGTDVRRLGTSIREKYELPIGQAVVAA